MLIIYLILMHHTTLYSYIDSFLWSTFREKKNELIQLLEKWKQDIWLTRNVFFGTICWLQLKSPMRKFIDHLSANVRNMFLT